MNNVVGKVASTINILHVNIRQLTETSWLHILQARCCYLLVNNHHHYVLTAISLSLCHSTPPSENPPVGDFAVMAWNLICCLGGHPDFMKVPVVGVLSLRYAGFSLLIDTQSCFALVLILYAIGDFSMTWWGSVYGRVSGSLWGCRWRKMYLQVERSLGICFFVDSL